MDIHMPNDDELKIINLKKKIANQLSKVISNELNVQKDLKDLATHMEKSANSKRDLINTDKELLKYLNLATVNPSSNIEKEDIDTVEHRINALAKSLQNQLSLADAVHDLSNTMKEFLKKKQTYLDDLSKLTALEENWQSKVMNYLKQKNKFVDKSKLEKLENKIGQIEMEIKRMRKLNDIKMNQLLDNAQSMDKAWRFVKNAILDYGW